MNVVLTVQKETAARSADSIYICACSQCVYKGTHVKKRRLNNEAFSCNFPSITNGPIRFIALGIPENVCSSSYAIQVPSSPCYKHVYQLCTEEGSAAPGIRLVLLVDRQHADVTGGHSVGVGHVTA